jgi:hypothetical protein
MFGAWTQYPQSQPQDGEGVTVIDQAWDDIETALNGPRILASVCMFRGGYLHDQYGGYKAMMPGQWWTSLPPASARA